MPPTPHTAGRSAVDSELSASVKDEALRVGFDLVGIAPAVAPGGFDHLQEWLRRGYAGEMQYIERREEAYAHPGGVLESARSVIMLAINYRTAEPAEPEPTQGLVARYAWGTADYHDLLRGKLKQLAEFIHSRRPGCRTRGVIDTAPLLERDFARLAGLGWFGKNTMLINKRKGSWLFLAALLVDIELECDQPHDTSHCGTCTRCLDACPTEAFPAPYVLDARRCISYHTIELREPIPDEFREPLGHWLFGCDICQEVCPWNTKAPVKQEPAFLPVADLHPADAIELLRLDVEQFRTRFRDTPLSRPRRAGLLRNAAIVLGNSGDPRAIPVLRTALADEEPLIRGAAAWALGRLGGKPEAALLQTRNKAEDSAEVSGEFDSALRAIASRS